MHISLDGFVAGPNGEMHWITVNDEIFDFVGQRISRGDTALYGRVTFEMMENYWPSAGQKPNASRHDIEHSKWYANVHKLVLSKTLDEANFSNTEIISADIGERINKIKQKNGPDILLFGSPTATHSLIELGLIDGYWLFVNPVILGKGIPLFKNTNDMVKLKLLNTHQFSSGVTELNYVVDKDN